MISRRSLLFGAAAGLTAAAAPAARAELKIGVTDWNLGLTGKLEAVALAQSIGFDGVQVSIGRKVADGKLPLDNPEAIARYVAEARTRKVPICSTCLDILHTNCLKNDALAEKWITDGIRITHDLGTRVMLLPFFGKCAMANRADVDRVGDALRDLAPAAAKANVILGVENTVSAEDNLRILERAKSPAVQVYYDVGNSTNGGFDILKEIRQIGADRICQFHFKDNPHYLGEGKVDLPAAVRTVAEIGYRGFANLETDNPSKNVPEDMRRNLVFVRRIVSESKI